MPRRAPTHPTGATGDALRAALLAAKSRLPDTHVTRLYRAISWLRCAEQYGEQDADLGFIALWIALNACYANDDSTAPQIFHRQFRDFSYRLVGLDHNKHIYNCLWQNFSGFVRLLIDNHFLYDHYWRARREQRDDWQRAFRRDRSTANHALASGHTTLLLRIVMSRLYVLRNQLLHGGATWQGHVNREQVHDGHRLLLELIPIIIKTMFDHSDDWGEICYPVVNPNEPVPA